MDIKNKFAVELGRLGGGKKSAKKKKASRLNGRKGGRPVKIKETSLDLPNENK